MNLLPEDDRDINWSRELEEEKKTLVQKAEFSPYESVHHDHSCESIESDDDRALIKKEKNRNYSTEQLEFTALELWNEVLSEYNEQMDVGIYSPTPYCHSHDGGLVMELINGENWAPFDQVTTPGQEQLIEGYEQVRDVARRLGQLSRIMEVEGLHHGDIHLRHVLVNRNTQEIGMIDLEGMYRAQDMSETSAEVRDLERRPLDRLQKVKKYEDSKIKDWYHEGRESIPDTPLSGVLHYRGFQDDLPEEIGHSIESVFGY